ncbi:MAG: peptidoglycan-binding protein [Thermoleophilia bacterium]|nr:peptidoglycan-binding protein [Thermoleophilia bacterium]
MTLLATAVTVLAAAMPVPSAEATAPLTVTFRAQGEAAFYRWDFGDGATGDGAVVEHAYAAPGRYLATLTTDAGEATVEAVAYRIRFGAPGRARFGASGRFSGSIWPAVAGAPVQVLGPAGTIARTRTSANGGFSVHARVRGTGPFRAQVAGLLSTVDSVRLRPAIDARLVGSGLVGDRLRLVAAVRPADAGTLTATVWRNGGRAYSGPVGRALDLSTGSPASFRVRVELAPAEGYLAHARLLRGAVVRPSLGPGARGEGVRVLQRRLVELRYALPAVDGVYGLTTSQAVLAFQKVEGLPRSGRGDARTWRRLLAARAPRARYPGTHLEVSKGRQVLFVVVRGRVSLAVHVSTGATGNTPLGHWRIYRKVTGWDWVLWYPMYFLRGFAVHGYPEVPAYPASHGCVRVPMWIAPLLFREHGYGQSVYIYW